MGYRGTWNSTDQIPTRAVADGRIGRFGLVDSTDGGESSRYSASLEWQRSNGNASTTLSAYGLKYDLDLFSNFTYFLDDPENGDQFQQTDHRFVSGARLTHRRIGRWMDRPTQNTVGIQFRNDNIGDIGLYHTRERERLETIRQDSVIQTSTGAFAQNETEWTPWLRTLAGLRVDGYRFDVNAGITENGGTDYAGLVSPKGGAVFGPFAKTEVYVNAGLGFHSNDARGATITVDPVTGEPASRVTPLARATGAEIGIRTVRIPRLQMTRHGVDARARFRARVRGRRRDNGPRPAEPPPGNRVDDVLLVVWRSRDPLPAVVLIRLRRRPRTLQSAVHRRRPGRRSHPRRRRHRRFGWCDRRQRARDVWQRAVEILRPARARRGRLRPLEGDEPRQSHCRLQDHALSAPRARRVQPLQPIRQRHRLLLQVTPPRRTRRRHR